MNWRKLGRIFSASGEYPWMQTHASNPVAETINHSLVRIYFNCRDADGRSHVGWLVLDLNHPQEILELSNRPALSPGPKGSFDDCGVSLGCLVPQTQETRLYYVGWNLAKTTPWRNAIGLALRKNGADGQLIFERFAAGPILDRDPYDPYNLSYPWVFHDQGSWKMWYGTNLMPMPDDLREIPHAFKFALSQDGVNWTRKHDHLCLGGALTGDCAFTRPCVIRDPDCYRMWYSHRGAVYQLGYAESQDGLNWIRCDERVGIAPSLDGWDSGSLSYPSVFDHAGQRFMLYNGPNYGSSGFGLAILEQG